MRRNAPNGSSLFTSSTAFRTNEHLRLKTAIADPYRRKSTHPTANWLEREVFDMFGMELAGHADLLAHPHAGSAVQRLFDSRVLGAKPPGH
jgi:hypothetical protein